MGHCVRHCDPNLPIIFSEVSTGGDCETGFTVTRTWTVSDRCGNESSATQVITVVDTLEPRLLGSRLVRGFHGCKLLLKVSAG